MSSVAHDESIADDAYFAPAGNAWFVCLDSSQASLRIAHGDVLGVTSNGEPCFAFESAQHAVQFICVRESLFVGHREGRVQVDGIETDITERLVSSSRVQLGPLSVTISSGPLPAVLPTPDLKRGETPEGWAPIRVAEQHSDVAVVHG